MQLPPIKLGGDFTCTHHFFKSVLGFGFKHTEYIYIYIHTYVHTYIYMYINKNQSMNCHFFSMYFVVHELLVKMIRELTPLKN